jgi:hypothetical protein
MMETVTHLVYFALGIPIGMQVVILWGLWCEIRELRDI